MEENNARFTSDVRLDLDTYREYLRLYLHTDPRNFVVRILISFFCVSMISILGNNDFSRMYLVFAIAIALIEWNAHRKNLDGGLGYKQLLHQESGNIPNNLLLFLQDGILFRNPRTGNEIMERYDSIREIRETKHLLILITDLKFQRIIDKRTLTGGSSAELLAFLREKCPNLKKKVSTGRAGQIVCYVQWVLIVLGVVWSILGLLGVADKLA